MRSKIWPRFLSGSTSKYKNPWTVAHSKYNRLTERSAPDKHRKIEHDVMIYQHNNIGTFFLM